MMVMHKVTGKKYILMVNIMKVSGLKIKLMAEGNMFTQMDQPMKVIG